MIRPSCEVSVIIPAYNASHYVRGAVASVLGQTFSDLEVLVVDDSSTDETVDIVTQMAVRDRRVRLLRHTANRGPATARNTALSAASGRYIAFLDSDDMWLSRKLETQIQFMKEKEAAFSYTSYRRISTSGEIISGPVPIPHTLDYNHLLKNTAIATSTVLVDRAQVGSLRMVDTYYDDYAMWLNLTKRGFQAHGLQEDLMRYRIVLGSVSRNKLRSARHVWTVYRDVERLSFLGSLWYFTNYLWNGYKKYRIPMTDT